MDNRAVHRPPIGGTQEQRVLLLRRRHFLFTSFERTTECPVTFLLLFGRDSPTATIDNFLTAFVCVCMCLCVYYVGVFCSLMCLLKVKRNRIRKIIRNKNEKVDIKEQQ